MPLPTSDTLTPPLASDHVYVARQPIFDQRHRRIAYELLYRASAEAVDAGTISRDAMCGETALHAMVSIGMERLAGGCTAFINVTRAHFVAELHKLFDPKSVVIELVESIVADDAVLESCARAVADGYTLALDDYDGRAALDSLLPFVKIIKLDVLDVEPAELERRIARVQGRGLTLLAERVETPEMLAYCEALGCTMFQGYVFSRPEVLNGRAVSLAQTTIFQVLAMLADPAATESAIEDTFRSQPSLSLALLRIVNSVSFGVQRVHSITQAIRLIGRVALSRWLLVMLATSTASQGPVAHEAVMHALVRSRFCELLNLRTAPGEPGSRFLVGLVSRLDALLGISMAEVLERLPLGVDMRDALLTDSGPYAPMLQLARAYDAGDWTTVEGREDDVPGGAAELVLTYTDATTWASERLG